MLNPVDYRHFPAPAFAGVLLQGLE